MVHESDQACIINVVKNRLSVPGFSRSAQEVAKKLSRSPAGEAGGYAQRCWMDFNAHSLANTAWALAKVAGVDVACLAELPRIAPRAARFSCPLDCFQCPEWRHHDS